MNLPQELTTHTRTAKVLATITILTLPFIGFFAGMKYQDNLSSAMIMNSEDSQNKITLDISITPVSSSQPKPWTTEDVTNSFDKTHNIAIVNALGFSFQYPKSFGKALYISDLKQIRVGDGSEFPVLINTFSDPKHTTKESTAYAKITQDMGCNIYYGVLRRINEDDYADISFRSNYVSNNFTEEECDTLWNSLPKDRINTATAMPYKVSLIELKDSEIPISFKQTYIQFKELVDSFKVFN